MLQKLSDQIRACYERAAEAKRKAETTTDPDLKADLLEVDQRWLALARSYAFTDGLGDFTAAMSEWQQKADQTPGTALYDALRLQEISTLLIQDNAIEAVYGRLLDVLISLMSSAINSMQELDPERGQLRLLAWRGFHPESAAYWEWVHLDAASTCGQALSSGGRVIVSDIEACEWMAGTADLNAYRGSGIRAVGFLGFARSSFCRPMHLLRSVMLDRQLAHAFSEEGLLGTPCDRACGSRCRRRA
jgi:hypothetical protein